MASYTKDDERADDKFAQVNYYIAILENLFKTHPHIISYLNIKIRDATNDDYYVPEEIKDLCKVIDVSISEHLCNKLSCTASKNLGPCSPDEPASYWYNGDSKVSPQCQPACFNLIAKPTYSKDGTRELDMPQLTWHNNKCKIISYATKAYMEKPGIRSQTRFEIRNNDMPTGWTEIPDNDPFGAGFIHENNQSYCEYYDRNLMEDKSCDYKFFEKYILDSVIGMNVINSVKSSIRYLINGNIQLPVPRRAPKLPKIEGILKVNEWKNDIKTDFKLPEYIRRKPKQKIENSRSKREIKIPNTEYTFDIKNDEQKINLKKSNETRRNFFFVEDLIAITNEYSGKIDFQINKTTQKLNKLMFYLDQVDETDDIGMEKVRHTRDVRNLSDNFFDDNGEFDKIVEKILDENNDDENDKFEIRKIRNINENSKNNADDDDFVSINEDENLNKFTHHSSFISIELAKEREIRQNKLTNIIASDVAIKKVFSTNNINNNNDNNNNTRIHKKSVIDSKNKIPNSTYDDNEKIQINDYSDLFNPTRTDISNKVKKLIELNRPIMIQRLRRSLHNNIQKNHKTRKDSNTDEPILALDDEEIVEKLEDYGKKFLEIIYNLIKETLTEDGLRQIAISTAFEMLLKKLRSRILKLIQRLSGYLLKIPPVLLSTFGKNVLKTAFKTIVATTVKRFIVKGISKFAIALLKILASAISIVLWITLIFSFLDILLMFWDPFGYNNMFPPSVGEDIDRTGEKNLRSTLNVITPEISFDYLISRLMNEDDLLEISIRSLDDRLLYLDSLVVNSEGARIDKGSKFNINGLPTNIKNAVGDDSEKIACAQQYQITAEQFTKYNKQFFQRLNLNNTLSWIVGVSTIALFASALFELYIIVFILLCVIMIVVATMNYSILDNISLDAYLKLKRWYYEWGPINSKLSGN